MLAKALASLLDQPIYLARLPWIGPIRGEVDPQHGSVRVAVAADPAVADLHSAVLVPVRREGGRLVEAHRRLFKRFPKKESEVELMVPEACWVAPAHGVLAIVIYDWSKTLQLAFRSESGAKAAQAKLTLHAAQQAAGMVASKADRAAFLERVDALIGLLDALKPSADLRPYEEMPPPMRDEIDKRVKELLASPADALAPGVIELAHSGVSRVRPASDITLAVASCQFPAGFFDREVACRSYERLAGRLAGDDSRKPQCLLLLGDQVYVDSTAGLFDPSAQYDRYHEPHQRLLRLAPVQQVLRRIPLYAMLDDHEIVDNWEPCDADPTQQERLTLGREAYFRYQRMAGPPRELPSNDSPDPVWYRFSVAGFPFFMADTRTERKPRTAETIMSARIMSNNQFGKLKQWLTDAQQSFRNTPKFVASPACFLPRHVHASPDRTFDSALRSDAWDGYPASLCELLKHIFANDIENVVFLSGDEHFSFAVQADVEDQKTKKKVRLYSIHSSGLYSPLPFSNAAAESLRFNDTFPLVAAPGGESLSCTVTPKMIAPGDGFALVHVEKRGTQWSVECLFDRAGTPGKWFDVLP